jgi:homoserine O-acetyltransferase
MSTADRRGGGDTARALHAIEARVLYMPSTSGLYFPLSDARAESRFLRRVNFVPIESLWGHPAGAGASAADLIFLNAKIRAFVQ